MMQSWVGDIRYALRLLRKSPGFTITALLTLALGIGANTAVFSVVNGVLLQALPYDHPESLVLLWGAKPDAGKQRDQVSYMDSVDAYRQTTAFERVATFSDSWNPSLSGGAGAAEQVAALQVSDGFFEVMRGKAWLGRALNAKDQIDGNDFVVVLDHKFWRTRFGADTSIIGKTIRLNTRPYLVVGVMPPDFRGLPLSLIEKHTQLYRPLAYREDESQRTWRHLRAIARLKKGVSLDEAGAQLQTVSKRLALDHPDSNSGYAITAASFADDTLRTFRSPLWLLLGAVSLVLLIACANIANLLLARASARQREIAVRVALGASRFRLIRQSMTESTVLAIFGGFIGWALALFVLRIAKATGGTVLPSDFSITPDVKVLLFSLAVTLVMGLVSGLLPALLTSKPDLQVYLKDSSGQSTTRSGQRLRHGLVVAEFALTAVLLVGAGLLLRSLQALTNVDPGFNFANVATLTVSLPGAKFQTDPAINNYFDRVLTEFRSLPGVSSVGATSVVPMGENWDRVTVFPEGISYPKGEEPDVERHIVSAGYAETMSLRLVSGRFFTDADQPNTAPVLLVSESMARQLWPSQDAIGRRLRLPGDNEPLRTVIGVLRDVKQYGLDDPSLAQMYLPYPQSPRTYMSFVARTTSDPEQLSGTLQRKLTDIDPDVAAFNVASLDKLLKRSFAARNFLTWLLAGFGVLAIILSAVGIYGVFSVVVSQRRAEIGIRMALGASRRKVLAMILSQSAKLAAAGLLVGLMLGMFVSRLAASLLFGVSPFDFVSYALAAGLLFLAAMLATWLPARRAAALDPMIALRYE